jgi:hypothetical protein
MVYRVLWTHLRVSTLLFVLAHGNKYPWSADTSELYLVTRDHKKYLGMSLILYPQMEAIHLIPTFELKLLGQENMTILEPNTLWKQLVYFSLLPTPACWQSLCLCTGACSYQTQATSENGGYRIIAQFIPFRDLGWNLWKPNKYMFSLSHGF